MNAGIQKYYLNENNNCAEAVLRTLNETYGFHLSEKDIHLVSGFGGGCGCGKICGALAGAIAALGCLEVETKAHETLGFREHCGMLCKTFEEAMGSTECREVKPKQFREGVRCASVLEAAVSGFEQIAGEKRK